MLTAMKKFIFTVLIIFISAFLISCSSSEAWQDTPNKPFDTKFNHMANVPNNNTNVIFLKASEKLEYDLQEAIIAAKSGMTIVLPKGKYFLKGEINISTPHITLAGQGMQKTILNFSKQESGAQGIFIMSDGVVIQDISIEDTVGDAIKMEGVDGTHMNRVHVEWTRGPQKTNGSYGFYPVKSKNVLIENSIVRGASDAGIYVGQSTNIIVRNNIAELNVAGINIENSTHVDIYKNWLAYNTAGVLILNLPEINAEGHSARVFDNIIFDNHTENFSSKGNIVNLASAGTGIMILANGNTEVFSNLVRKHNFLSIFIADYSITGYLFANQNYNPFIHDVSVYKNKIQTYKTTNISSDKSNADFKLLLKQSLSSEILTHKELNAILNHYLKGNMPDILYAVSKKIKNNDAKNEYHNCVFKNNAGGILNFRNSSFKQLDIFPANTVSNIGQRFSVARKTMPISCRPKHYLKPIVLNMHKQNDVLVDTQVRNTSIALSDEKLLCNKKTTGVNWSAFAVNCTNLSAYNLFSDAQNPTEKANNQGIKYDITTPLFSDYTLKHRFVFVPPNSQAKFSSAGPFQFPVGTIIAKTFQAPVDAALLETRLLIHRESGWIALPYIWEKSQAKLALGGGVKKMKWNKKDKTLYTNYQIPNANQCKNCHLQNNKMQPIGLKMKWLNKNFSYKAINKNQLLHWRDMNILSDVPQDITQMIREPLWNNPNDGSLRQRAKAYLDINCAHCHNPMGQARSTGLTLLSEQSLDTKYGLCKPPVAAGQGSGGLSYDIVPKKPDESILMYRLKSNHPAIKMPELGRSVVHQEGVDLIETWISSLEGRCIGAYQISL